MNRQQTLGVILGLILIGAGVLFLLGELFQIDTMGLLWPAIVIAVGLMFFLGMYLVGPQAGFLAIPGSIITTVGLILFVQNTLNVWETWSYSWALIVAAVGVGIYIHGRWSNNPDLAKSGKDLTWVGIILFLIFGAIFNIIFSISGKETSGAIFWGVLLMAVGIILLISRSLRLMSGRAKGDDRDLFWPVIFIGIGLVWVLYNLGALGLAQITGLVQWWPILLIALGLDLLVGRRWPLVGALLGVLTVAFTLLLMANPPWLALPAV